MYAKALSYAALGLACAWGGWAVQGWRMEAKLSDLKTEYAQAQAAAVEKAHAETIRLQGQADEAQRLAAIRQSAISAAAAAARHELERVRNASTEALLLSGHSHATCLDRATALKEVFDQCSGAVVGLGEKADRHASDVQTMIQAWPK